MKALKWKMEQDAKKLKIENNDAAEDKWINHNNVWNSYKKQLKPGEPPRVCTMK